MGNSYKKLLEWNKERENKKIIKMVEWCSFHNIPFSICLKTSSSSCAYSLISVNEAIRKMYMENIDDKAIKKLIKENLVKVNIED